MKDEAKPQVEATVPTAGGESTAQLSVPVSPDISGPSRLRGLEKSTEVSGEPASQTVAQERKHKQNPLPVENHLIGSRSHFLSSGPRVRLLRKAALLWYRGMQGPRRWASHPPTHTQVSEGPEVTGAGRASHQCAHNSNALWEGPAPERWEELQKCPRRTGAPAGKQVKAMTTPAETSERA